MPDTPEKARTRKPRERRPKIKLQEILDLKKRLTDEYKILQDKIDKIGAFRFTIKGWAVAAIGAATAAASATKSFPTAVLVSVGLGILVVFFFRFEVEQVRLSRLFGSLAGKIERVFHEIDTEGLTRVHPTPVIGGEIVKAKELRKGRNRFRWWMAWRYFGTRHHFARQIWRDEIKEDWRVAGAAHISFYLFLLVLAFLPVGVQYRAVIKKVDKMWSYYYPPLPASPLPPAPPQEFKR